MLALLLMVLSTYHAPAVTLAYDGPVAVAADFTPADTGRGYCSMDQHFHNSDGACHADSTDAVVLLREQ